MRVMLWGRMGIFRRERREREDGRLRPGFFGRLGRYLGIIIILAVGLFASQALRLFAPKPQVEELGDRLPVVQAEPVSFETSAIMVGGNGIAEPRARVRLAAQVAGEVASVSPQMVSGGAFSKGDILLEIDTRLFDAAVMEAKAEKTSADARLVYARNQFDRAKALNESGFASKERIDQLRSQYAEAGAIAGRAEARVVRTSLDLEHARVAAPFDGRVASENVSEGTYLTPGALIGEIYATDIIEIVVSLSDEEASLLPDLWGNEEDGGLTKATSLVTSDYGGATYQWHGVAHRVRSEIDSATRTVDVVVRVGEPRSGLLVSSKEGYAGAPEAPPLLPGMYTRVEIEGRQLDSVATIPSVALRPDDKIWVVDSDDRVKSISVRVLQQRGNAVTIQSNALPSGALLITSNLRYMSENMKVRVRQPKGSASPLARKPIVTWITRS
jgi:RND family efflux transporter MFP subunit